MIMKKKLLIVAIVVGLCGTALALDPMGPPAAGLSQGQWSAGLEYSNSEMSIVALSKYRNQEHELQIHKIYGRVGYGIADNWEGFLRLGGAQMDYYRQKWGYVVEGAGDYGLAFGGGIKTTFHEQAPDLKWGALAQYSWFEFDQDTHGDDSKAGYSGSVRGVIKEWQIAAGPTWTPQEGLAIYGGPFLHYVGGDLTNKMGGSRNSHPFDEKTNFGGYAGAQVDIMDNCALAVEYQYTGDATAVAANLIWRY